MAKWDLRHAERVAFRNRPWTIRLEYYGSNSNNLSGVSSKYWYATGRFLTEQVEIGWGAVGSAPQHQLLDWPDLRTRVADKLAKGYQWGDTPYIRMSAGSMAKLTGQVPSSPAPAAAPVVKAVVKTVPAKTTTVTSTSLTVLGEPYSLIVAMKLVRDGTKVLGYKALDADGDEVLDFDPLNGLAFAQTHDIHINFT